MSNMDIGERRLPQDARIELKIGDSDIDVRVATLPTLFGECVVMRILDRTSVQIDLNKLGLSKKMQEEIGNVINKSSGLFLVTGPTGCGKTTTLYACLAELNQVGSKLISCEDPVELQIENIMQVQIREEIGLTFANSLRAILRQDPDIIMVGEVRDLHTNSAVETITRLLDMDVEAFLITSSLEGILAQRLMRKICRDCRQAFRPDPHEMDELGIPKSWRKSDDLKLYRPKGCPACDYIGYKGRTGVFELLPLNDDLREMILARKMSQDLRKYARKNLNMLTLREEALVKAVQGYTSADEVIEHTELYLD
jgi:type IV pilus assembly protein PilB